MSKDLERSIAAQLRAVARKLRHCAGQRLVLSLSEAAVLLKCEARDLERLARRGRVQLTWLDDLAISRAEIDRLRESGWRPRR